MIYAITGIGAALTLIGILLLLFVRKADVAVALRWKDAGVEGPAWIAILGMGVVLLAMAAYLGIPLLYEPPPRKEAATLPAEEVSVTPPAAATTPPADPILCHYPEPLSATGYFKKKTTRNSRKVAVHAEMASTYAENGWAFVKGSLRPKIIPVVTGNEAEGNGDCGEATEVDVQPTFIDFNSKIYNDHGWIGVSCRYDISVDMTKPGLKSPTDCPKQTQLPPAAAAK